MNNVNPDSLRPGRRNNREIGIGAVVREVIDSVTSVFRSEVHLAKAEFKEITDDLKQQATVVAIASVVAILGLLPLMAFLVIGLGELMNDNYWLSSLIVGVIFTGIGATVAASTIRKLRERDIKMPRLRDSIASERQVLTREAHEIREALNESATTEAEAKIRRAS